MYHYQFTNDLRISNLDSFLVEAAQCFKNNCVPKAYEDKNANNNMNTLGFYFNFTVDSNCTKECAAGEVRKTVLNFIKKFQFPNPRTQLSLNDSKEDGISLAPLRIILQVLYIMRMVCPEEAYLSNGEILECIFCNDSIAKTENPDLIGVIQKIVKSRENGDNYQIPESTVLEKKGIFWKQCERQLREMVKILTWSGCATITDNKKIMLQEDKLSTENKADLFDIITYTGFWMPKEGDSFDEIKADYQKYMDIPSEVDNWQSSNPKIVFRTGEVSCYSRNRILFGAPGTGKSFRLNKEKDELLNDGGEYERVTFHPDYSYANFVGTYKPVMGKDDEIAYKYVPGPFMRIYVKALKSAQMDNPKPHLLLIEEINRANVAAVFGDVFQLLDREDGVSEYPIAASEDMKLYLSENLGGNPDDYSEIKLPDNMFIWATMNSADQGVFPMDTAFKRRWDFTYIGIDENDEDIQGKYVLLGKNNNQKVEWNVLRKAINDKLAELSINEDKQLGPYFIKRNIVVPKDGNEINKDDFIAVFKSKVLMYLYEDAARQKRLQLFGENLRYSEICKKFDDVGINIFSSTVVDRINEASKAELNQ